MAVGTERRDAHRQKREARHQRVEAWKRGAHERVERSRSNSRSVDAAFVTSDNDRLVGGNLLASAIAYRFFLWLLPLALLTTALLGFTQSAGSGQPERVSDDLGLARSTVSVVSTAAQQAERSRFVVGAIALFGLYFAAAAGAKTMMAVHRFAWRMPPARGRGGPASAALFTLFAIAAMSLSVVAQVLRKHIPGLGLTAMISVLIPYAALWLGISVLLPHGRAPWYRLIPGALFLGIGTQLLHLVTVYYLAHKIEKASELYGGLGVAATLLLGLYLVSRLIVGAAVLNATLWERTRLRSELRQAEVASHTDGAESHVGGIESHAESATRAEAAGHPEVAGPATGALTVEGIDEAAVDRGPSGTFTRPE